MIRADPSRVVIRPFMPADDPPAFASAGCSRAQRVANRVLSLDETQLRHEWERVSDGLSNRHRDIEVILSRRFHEVNGLVIDPGSVTSTQALLIGGYFSEEYSFEAAALFNPSIVAHPDQSRTPAGAIRFILSLRGVGEGHISSVTFRTGLWSADGAVTLDEPSAEAISPRVESIPGGAPDDPGVRLFCDASRDLSEVVIYPITDHQRQGIEDLRLVRFTNDDGIVTYLGTYTAFGGRAIRQELLRTADFATFELSALRGDATANKGMALFPRKIGGRYAMLGRQDHENIWLLMSDDLYNWQGGTRTVTPRWPWEFIQIGNCGSPIEIDEGWLVLTHGVGAVRNYCIGACLLDKTDPTKVMARMTHPLLRCRAEERDGYVPNVIYSCGAILNRRTLLLPYAIADSFTTFARIEVDALLAAME
ncbi:glycoside hydrolase family 130 protein [Sphingomonas sp. So64.6b]|uniref:glycoside hydrolase family 130 protein n=1 Tax=Sphingomonas sp. So64.6b TaxID=2997354 RepID=UPI001FCE7DE5|nr:glycoside hydrolase family 130 protein [Sphingomonas sp. So64.6b]